MKIERNKIKEDTITLYPTGSNGRRKNIYCKSNWFSDAEYFQFINEDGSLIIKKCYLEIPKGAVKMSKNGYLQLNIDIPLGTFDIDFEDSNEDEIVVYYKN